MRKLLLAIVLLFAGGTFPLFAQQGRPEAQKVRVLLIFDFSNSMYGLWESDSKINIAKRLVSSMVDSLSRQLRWSWHCAAMATKKSTPRKIAMIQSSKSLLVKTMPG